MDDKLLAIRFAQQQYRVKELSEPTTPSKISAVNQVALMNAIVQVAKEHQLKPSDLAQRLQEPGRGQAASELIARGKAGLEQAYGQSYQSVQAQIEPRTQKLDVRSVGMSDDMRKMIEQGKQLKNTIVIESYMNRGRVDYAIQGSRQDALVSVNGKSDEAKEKLVQHMLKINAAIDHGVKTGTIPKEDAKFLGERFNKEIYSNSNPEKNNPEYNKFHDATVRNVQFEVNKAVQGREQKMEKAIDFAYNNPAFQKVIEQAVNQAPQQVQGRVKEIIEAKAAERANEQNAQKAPQTQAKVEPAKTKGDIER
ncbi:hypothetical protein [Iodobacter fluviatilis]|uniref:Uncharacterized protein n=1 Tax=Iodobacter fluviatilis TaxID=537 RepID=A0A7G3GF51_9NEIS|nr:hypothetical protein [Iodobacter fluviatilis]QBC45848.1 hypothetical protein C1H71_20105 [Iodobacter fluviatilis]